MIDSTSCRTIVSYPLIVPRRVETEEAESGIDSTFYESMVLLDDIIEVFTSSQLSAVGKGSFFLQLLDRRPIGWILIDVDCSRR